VDPYPFKHPAIILARIRNAVEPSLFAAGFQFDGRNQPTSPVYLYLDYSRTDELLRLAWDRRDSNCFIGLTAELFGVSERHAAIVAINVSELVKISRRHITAEIQSRIDSFVEGVSAFLNNMTPDK
jgi:hypothetical protein